MDKAIIVVTYPGSPWLKDCLDSLSGTKYPVILLYNQPLSGKYECEALYFAAREEIEDFVLLHDSVFVKDLPQLEDILELEGCIPFGPFPTMLIGKYSLFEIEEALPEKEPNSKTAAVAFEVSIAKKFPWQVPLYPEFSDANATDEFRNGRQNKRLECPLLVKWKGNWTPEHMQAVDLVEGRQVPWKVVPKSA